MNFKERYSWSRKYQGPIASFVYALEGWQLLLWYVAWGAFGWWLAGALS